MIANNLLNYTSARSQKTRDQVRVHNAFKYYERVGLITQHSYLKKHFVLPVYYWGIRGTVVQFSGRSTCTYQPEALSDQYMHLQRSCGQTHVQIRDHEVDN